MRMNLHSLVASFVLIPSQVQLELQQQPALASAGWKRHMKEVEPRLEVKLEQQLSEVLVSEPGYF